MRLKFYDNELLTIALFNHIKLIHEMDSDLLELKGVKERFDKEEAEKK